jgi:hypothetical protein
VRLARAMLSKLIDLRKPTKPEGRACTLGAAAGLPALEKACALEPLVEVAIMTLTGVRPIWERGADR